MAGRTHHAKTRWLHRALVLLLLVGLVGGAAWIVGQVADPGGALQAGPSPPTSEAPPMLLIGIGLAVAALYTLERSRRKALAALRVANRALQEQADLSRSIVELQTEAITRYDADLTITFVNAAFAQGEGKTPDELVGVSMRQLKSEDDLERFRSELATLTPERPNASFDVPVSHPDGTKQYRRWTDLAVFDEHGQVREYLSVGRDVTEQKVAELALQDSESRLRTVVSGRRWYCSPSTRIGCSRWPRAAPSKHSG